MSRRRTYASLRDVGADMTLTCIDHLMTLDQRRSVAQGACLVQDADEYVEMQLVVQLSAKSGKKETEACI